jgi:RNA polymerase sigma factor (sigma-70 family)
MLESCEKTQVDAALSRLIGLTPYRPELSQQQDWNSVRDFLRRRFAAASLGNAFDNQDLLQDCLIRAVKARQGWTGEGSLGAWFYRIAQNVIRDELRSRAHSLQVQYEDELIYEPPYERTAGQSAANHSRQLALFREWVRDNQHDDLLQFLDALIEHLNCRVPRTRMRFVVERLGLKDNGRYKALYERLKRASCLYPKRFEVGLSF